MRKTALSLLAASLFLAPLPALAQTSDNSQVMERMDRLEHDLMLLQRQVARGEPVTVSAGAGGDAPPGDAAQLEVRLSAIEEEMRDLRGKVEENDFQVKKLTDNLDKLQKDTDLRFSEQNGGAPGPGGPVAIAAEKTPPKKPFPPVDAGAPPAATNTKPPADTEGGLTTGGDGVLHPPSSGDDSGGSAQTNFATPREHYNYAFRLLNQTQYEGAATAFDSFTKKYPKDPLVGNAYYWEGETYYIRRDYVNAADYFRQGFESMPDGPKAADNLLKLAMSLDALGRDKEACVVLDQIVTKFKNNSTSVTTKADQEQKRIGCH